jgi:hypothetical protein
MKVELKVPKKYREVFDRLESESDLIDNCKYMLYFKRGYAWHGDYWCVPVKSKKEALEFIREYEQDRYYETETGDRVPNA